MHESPPDTEPTLNFFRASCAICVGAVVLFGGSQMLVAISKVDPHEKGAELPLTIEKFRDGTLTQSYEKKLDHKMPLRNEMISFANAVRYTLLRGGNDQIRIGSSDWLFFTDELRYEVNPAAQQQRIKLISQLSASLRTKGVHLVLALVPDKARVYSEFVPNGGYPEYKKSKYLSAMAALSAQQVSTVDLLTPMISAGRQDLYYRTDTHWNQRGAQLAATEIAKVVAGLHISFEKTPFKTIQDGQTQSRSGDLVRLMGLEGVPLPFRPKPDVEAPATTQLVNQQPATTSLFGEVTIPVVLTGTSYSLRGNFHGYLQEALNAKVLNTAKDGGGFLQGITGYLNDDSFKQSKPLLLVWELPERMLQTPIGDEAQWFSKIQPLLQ